MSLQSFLKEKTLGAFVKTNGVISRPIFGGKGFILCLHRVLPKQQHSKFWGSSGMAVSPEYLVWLINFIRKEGFELIALDEVLERLKDPTSRPFAAITLDDGWNDNLTFGVPVFFKYKVPFAIYVTICFPNGTALDWAETLTKLIAGKNHFSFSYDNINISQPINTIEQKVSVYNQMRYFIIDAASQLEFRNRINAVFSNAEYPPFCSSLNWKEIRELSNESICTIGAHTYNHVPLAKFSSADALKEIVDSKIELEEKTGKKIIHFAYPFGSKNECSFREFKLAEKAGFAMSVTGRQGNVFPNNKKFLSAVPRYPIGESTGEERLRHITNGILHFSFNGFKMVVTD